MSLVSLLCAVHNEEDYVGDFIESLMSQSCDDWELLIVDDGSTDATAEIVERYAAKDRRIQLVARGEKIGKVPAFNLAFEYSTGDILAITGGDDLAPRGAVAARVAAFEGVDPSVPTVAYFKLKTISDDPRFAGQILPRGDQGSRSGPGLAMNRALANDVFPVPAHLPSEDSWLTPATSHLARSIVHRPDIVVEYRIHAGNSNPRHKGFRQMSDAIAKRAEGTRLFLQARGADLDPTARDELTLRVKMEQFRQSGRLLRVLSQPGVKVADRLAIASMTKPWLWKIRQKYYVQLSGWRGR